MSGRTCGLTLAGLLAFSLAALPSSSWAQPAPAAPKPKPAGPIQPAPGAAPVQPNRPAPGAPGGAPARPAQPAPGPANRGAAAGIQLSAPNPLGLQPPAAPATVAPAGPPVAPAMPPTAYPPAPVPQPYTQDSYGTSLRTITPPAYVPPMPSHRAYEGGRLLALAKKDRTGLAWPLALEILPPALETKALRDQIDQVSDALFQGSGYGKPDPGLVSQLKEDVDELQALFRDRGDFLPVSDEALRDANRFLHRLRAAVLDLR
jgi:hypothetical protein